MLNIDRFYVRDGVAGLSKQDQLDMIADLNMPDVPIYIEDIPKAKLKKRDPEDLKERDSMLRPTSRDTPETIGVANLRVLGWTLEDILGALAKAAGRNATIYAIDVGEHFEPSGEAEKLRRAVQKASQELRKEQTRAGQRKGVEEARVAKLKRSEKKYKIAREIYGKPGVSVVEVIEESGLSRAQLWRKFGNLTDAQEKWKERNGKK